MDKVNNFLFLSPFSSSYPEFAVGLKNQLVKKSSASSNQHVSIDYYVNFNFS
jgi:hypothetical protein